jgi:septal ring-binding cell division protein DamX
LSDFGLSAGTPATGHAHDRHTLSAAVVKFLKSLKPLGAHALVIIDDAEQVGVDVYETVLQLAQAAGSDGNPLRLVLVGQPWLEGRLSAPPLSEFPPDGHWRRVTVGLDERGDVPEALSTLASPSLATSTPTPRTRTGALAMSPRLLALGGLLVLVAIGAWWATRGATPQSPSTPSFAPATPATAATQPPTAPAPPTPAATSPAVGPASSNATTGPTSAGVAGGAAAAQTAVPSATSAAAPASRESFRIVVASFETATRAQQTVSDLQRHQLAATVRTDPTNTWHQVVAGPYPSIDAARQAQRTIEQAGFADTQISLVRQTTNR